MSRRPRYIRDANGLKQLAVDALIDLHVFVIPPDYWRDYIITDHDRVISETWSAGYIRVHPDASLLRVREEIAYQLRYDVVPRSFVFLRSVGRNFQQVTPKQEHELQAKYFTPPEALRSELYIMDATAAGRYRIATPTPSVTTYASSADDIIPTYRRSRDYYLSPSLTSRTISTQTGADTYLDLDRVYLQRRERLLPMYTTVPVPIQVTNTAELETIRLEILRLRENRANLENLRNDMLNRSSFLKSFTFRSNYNRKNHLDGRDIWKKRYYEEKKKGSPMEDQCQKMRQELIQLQRRILSQLETTLDQGKLPDGGLIDRAQMRILATQFENDIDELQYRLAAVKMKITAEIKLRIQAETEMKTLKWILAAGRRGNPTSTRTEAYRAALLSARRSRSESRPPPLDLTITSMTPRSWIQPNQSD